MMFGLCSWCGKWYCGTSLLVFRFCNDFSIISLVLLAVLSICFAHLYHPSMSLGGFSKFMILTCNLTGKVSLKKLTTASCHIPISPFPLFLDLILCSFISISFRLCDASAFYYFFLIPLPTTFVTPSSVLCPLSTFPFSVTLSLHHPHSVFHPPYPKRTQEICIRKKA